MKKADLHIHSTVSDGSFTISELVARAKEKDLDIIAITDHDTLSQAGQIPKTAGILVIPGIEISAYDYDHGFRVHILGYGIQKPEVTEQTVHVTLEARHENSLRQIAVLNEYGYDIDIKTLRKADGKYIYKQHIMDDLVRRGKAPDMFGKFYQRIFKNGGICDFDICYPSPLEALRAIKDAGGMAVLAHSGQQQNFCLIPELAAKGLDGLELNHHANNERDKAIICQYAKEYDLFLTGGSDFHGKFEDVSVDVGDFLAEQSGIDHIFRKGGYNDSTGDSCRSADGVSIDL